MSDFGSLIVIKRKDGEVISTEQRKEMEALMADMKAKAQYVDMFGEPVRFKRKNTKNSRELVFICTEYWQGDGDEEDNFDFAKANDFRQVKEAATVITQQLGDSYLAEARFLEW